MQLSYKFSSLTAALLFVASSQAETSLDFEWDPYYSNADYYIGLTKDPILEVGFGVGFILERDKFSGRLQREPGDFRLILRLGFQF